MADMVTVQELENAKIDARTIGESVNENKIVTPRYGAPFKSMPMIAEEMQSVIGTIIAGGVPTSIVLDGNQTQDEINLYGGKKYDMPDGGYPIGAKVLLDDNLTEVTNAVASNQNNPNIDMAGWIFETQRNTSVVDFSKFWKKSTTANCRAVLQLAVDLTPDGGSLIIPFDIYFEGTITCKNKNINIYNYGEIKWKPSASTAFIFSTDDHVLVSASTLSALPKKGDTKLNFTTAPSVTHPSDYYLNITSTENEIRRLDPDSYYTKNHTNDITTLDYILRAPVPTSFNDVSKMSIKLVKKGTPVEHVGLRITPTEQPAVSMNYVEYGLCSNIVQRNWKFRSSGKQFSGQQCAYNHCFNIWAYHCYIYGANATDSDNYQFVQFNCAFMGWENCGYYDADNVAKRSRGLAGRHGFMNTANQCLFAGVDDHWGHDYFIRNMSMTRGVGISGGSVTIENCESTGALFSQRGDTPYNDGKLTIRNSKTYGQLFVATRVNYPSKFTRNKLFDVIDIDADVYVTAANASPIFATTDGWDEDDCFHDTVADIKLRVFQENGKTRNIWAQGASPYNPTLDGNRDVARMFKKINLNIEHIFTDNSDTTTNQIALYGVCADKISINMNLLTYDQIRANELVVSSELGLKNPASSGARLKCNNILFKCFKFLSTAQAVNYGAFTPKINVQIGNFNTWAQADGLNWSFIESAFGNTINEITKPVYSQNRNWFNYDKNNQIRYVLSAELIIPDSAVSAVFTVNMPRYSPQDFLLAQLDVFDPYVQVETFDNGNTNGTINFRIRNLTKNEVTVAAGRAITFKIV